MIAIRVCDNNKHKWKKVMKIGKKTMYQCERCGIHDSWSDK